jgi:hypothetical protein
LGPGNSHISQWFEKKERSMRPAEKGYEKDQTAQHRPAQESSALFTAQRQGWKTLRPVLIDLGSDATRQFRTKFCKSKNEDPVATDRCND